MKRLIAKPKSMKIIRAFLLLSTLLLFNNLGFSQDLTEPEISELHQLKVDIEGTYQFQMIDTRSLPSVHISIFWEIENLRDDTEIIYYQYSENMRVMILPRSIIEVSDFQMIESIVFISSTQIEK